MSLIFFFLKSQSRRLAPVSLFSLYAKLMVGCAFLQESGINLLTLLPTG